MGGLEVDLGGRQGGGRGGGRERNGVKTISVSKLKTSKNEIKMRGCIELWPE